MLEAFSAGVGGHALALFAFGGNAGASNLFFTGRRARLTNIAGRLAIGFGLGKFDGLGCLRIAAVGGVVLIAAGRSIHHGLQGFRTTLSGCCFYGRNFLGGCGLIG